MSEPQFQVLLLGPPEIHWAGRPMAIPRRQLRALLYLFALRPRPVPREQILLTLCGPPYPMSRRAVT